MSPASIPEGSSGTEGEEGSCDKKAFYWLKEPALLSEYFLIFEFKVTLCPLQEVHDWRQCPFAHPAERDRRRCPCTTRHALSKTATCPIYRKGKYCARFEACPYAHGVFETWLHPRQYRIQMCSEGASCKRELCFFAHNKAQLRFPTPHEEIPALRARLAEENMADVQAACKRLGFAGESNAATLKAQGPGGGCALESAVPPSPEGSLLSSATSHAQSYELDLPHSGQLSDSGPPVRQRRLSARNLPVFRPERSFSSSGEPIRGRLREEVHKLNAQHQQGLREGSSDGGGRSTWMNGFCESGQMYRSCSAPDADTMPPLERLLPAARTQSDSLSMLLESLDHLELLHSGSGRGSCDLSRFSSSALSSTSAASELLTRPQMPNLRAAGLQTMPVQMGSDSSVSSAMEEMTQARALALCTTPGYYESAMSASTAAAQMPRAHALSLPWASESCPPADLQAIPVGDRNRPWSPGLSVTDMRGISTGGMGQSGGDLAHESPSCVTESQDGVQVWPLDLFVPSAQPRQPSYAAGVFSEDVSIISPFHEQPPLLDGNSDAHRGPNLQDVFLTAGVDNNVM